MKAFEKTHVRLELGPSHPSEKWRGGCMRLLEREGGEIVLEIEQEECRIGVMLSPSQGFDLLRTLRGVGNLDAGAVFRLEDQVDDQVDVQGDLFLVRTSNRGEPYADGFELDWRRGEISYFLRDRDVGQFTSVLERLVHARAAALGHGRKAAGRGWAAQEGAGDDLASDRNPKP